MGPHAKWAIITGTSMWMLEIICWTKSGEQPVPGTSISQEAREVLIYVRMNINSDSLEVGFTESNLCSGPALAHRTGSVTTTSTQPWTTSPTHWNKEPSVTMCQSRHRYRSILFDWTPSTQSFAWAGPLEIWAAEEKNKSPRNEWAHLGLIQTSEEMERIFSLINSFEQNWKSKTWWCVIYCLFMLLDSPD